MKTIALSTQVREGLGKGNSKRLRSEGFVPAIFYGYKTEPVAVKVNTSELIKVLVEEKGETAFVKLGIESGKGGKVEKLSIIKDLQIDTINRKPVHVDFYEIGMDRTLVVNVPIIFSGNPVGVEDGGELQQLKRALKVSGLPSDLPESVEIDVSGLNIGDSIEVKDIAIKDGIQILDPDDVAVASVVPTRVSQVTEEAGEEEEAVTEEAASASEGEEGQGEQ
ncbi:MAG: 50S ribosomal protein L25 [Deltaproteobacteria bacterium]|nr:50S ribosomal protein L25 [Deltaproteobacteria bacterium]MBW2651430.1 50S ribosomal protein L25 [Deltaproteobacteria bacterium]